MKLKQLIIFAFVLLSGLSCYADDGTHGFPKEWETWRAKLEKDSGKVIAFSVKRNWVLYSKPDSKSEPDFDSYWIRNMRKKKDWNAGLIIFDSSTLPTVNIDTCKTNYVINGPAAYSQKISRDGRGLLCEIQERGKSVDYQSLETGKVYHLYEGSCLYRSVNLYDADYSTFDTDSTFYVWEGVYCNKKGDLISLDKVSKYIRRMEEREKLLLGWIPYVGLSLSRGELYKDYYRKVRYNTKGEKLSVGKPISGRKVLEEHWQISNDVLNLESWEAKLYDDRGREVEESTRLADNEWNWSKKKDSLINQDVYTYYYHRKDQWADAMEDDREYTMLFKRYTKAAVLYLEKQKWGLQNEVPQDEIYQDKTKCYRWMPVLCDSLGRIASDNVIYPTDDEYHIEDKIIDAKDVEEALRTGKIHYLYRMMWYDTFDYIGSDAKLYTKDEVTAIEKNHFRWPDEW